MIYLDFETRSAADLIKWGATRYALDPTTQALCLCWSFDQDPEIQLWHRDHPWIEKSERPDDLLDRIASGEHVEAHNSFFEFSIWNLVLRKEFPEFDVPLSLDQMRCSAAKASCYSLPRALGDAAKAVHLPAGLQKDEDGRRLINKLCKPMSRRKGSTDIIFCEEEVEHRRNWNYCAQDIRAERGLSNWCDERGGMTETETRYWQMDQRMNMRGVMLDQKAAHEALKLAITEAARLNAELCEITGGAVDRASRRAVFKKWANRTLDAIHVETGVETGQLPNTKADTLSFILYGVPTKAGEDARKAAKPIQDAKWARWGDAAATLHRSFEICLEVNRTSVGKFKQMVDSVSPDDGRLHDIMLYNGADRTGRWSGKGVQPHNFVRGYSKEMGEAWDDILTLDLDYVTILWGEALPALAKACRGALTASPGKTLYAADFNAIEARKLAWLAGCASQLELFRSGGDPYIDMASGIYKIKCDPTDKEQIKWFKKHHASERQLGKRAVLGLGYAMGWEKFQATVWGEEGIWLDDEFCQLVVNIYRKHKCPEVPRLWKSVGEAAIAAVVEGGERYAGGDETGIGAISYFVDGPFLHCRLPSGRLLAYLYPEVHTKLTWRFNATNERGKPCTVSFPSKMNVATWKARRHAEQMAIKQRKHLLNEPPENFTSPHLSFMGRDTFTRKWKRCGTHGGSLVENADQASSRDLLAEAMFRVDQIDDFDLLLSIHDEVIAEGHPDVCSVKEFEALMSEVRWWAPGMPITAEGWKGPRLRK